MEKYFEFSCECVRLFFFLAKDRLKKSLTDRTRCARLIYVYV